MRSSNQKGTVLITLIVAMLIISVLGAGIYSLTTTSTFTGLLSNKNDQAYHLAQAGVRYAIDEIIQAYPNYPSTDFFLPDNNHKFNITVVSDVITSVGIVNEGTFSETRRQIIYNVANSWSPSGTIPLPVPQEPVISLPNDTASFAPTESNPSAVAVAPDGTITLGGNVGDSYGTLLYQGSSSVSNCNTGACNFPYGLRAYFNFTFAEDNSSGSTTRGDGFIFTVLSAINNTRDRSGGAPPSISSGELMGYAGPDNTADMLGLKPPKMAVEFDTYPNSNGDICGSNSRNDNNGAVPANFLNHMSIMFWGENVPAGALCSGIYPRNSYDDNRHGVGTPVNSYYGYTGGGYYEGTKSLATTNCNSAPTTTCNWMEDGHTYGFRMEIVRVDGTGDPVNGLYQINGWIYRDLANEPTGFQDVTNTFTAEVPHISRTVTLTAAEHAALRQVYFGFTEATGGATQNITIGNLKVFFPQTLAACTYYINPTSAAYALAGGSGSVSFYASRPDCTWTAVSNNAWITVTGSASGTGNGTVTYTVAANTVTVRTGTITIAGQTFTVTQDGCTYAINPTSRAHTSSAATGQTVTVTAGTGCTWTAVRNDTWITITGGASGTGNGIVTYSITANTGPVRTGTITIAGLTFTVTQATGCTYAINPTSPNPASFTASAGSGTFSVTAGSACPWSASTASTWIHTTSTGTGNGSGTYTVDANTGVLRTGTIVAGGQSFTVTQSAPPPVVTVINPNTGNNDNVRFNVTITGTGFQAGATVTRSAGTGGTFTIDNVVFVSATQITARFRINSNVPVGAQTIRVTNTDGQYGEILFTVY